MTGLVRAVQRLSWRERARAGEAILLLTVASIAIRIAPFRRVLAATDRVRLRQQTAAADPAVVAATVVACADRLLWHPLCFPRGLAAHLMLRRRGIASTLHYGVAQLPERGLNAHVWVVAGDAIVIGAKGLAGHSSLIRIPSGPDAGR